MNVYVVHGPPLSGKSTYVQEHKGPNDLVFDFGLIMSALSGLPVHQHNENLIGYVLDIRDLIINRLRHEDKLDAAWIIVTTIRPRLRQALSGIDVKYIELSVDEATARRRLRDDPDGRDIAVWDQVIDKHFQTAEVRKLYKSAAWLRVREQVLERDNYECQECKRRGSFSKGNVVHHIKHLADRPDLALEADNLMTVCEECHNRLHPEKFRTAKRERKEYITPERW